MEELENGKLYFCNQEEDIESEDYEFEDASFADVEED